jgi:RNA polymerase sigma-70 factor, ECF subfamily
VVRPWSGEVWCTASYSSAEDVEEACWLDRARAGDEAGYAWLLSRYRSRVVRLAAHVLRRPAEAEDAAQEAFIRAFRNLRAFRGEGRFYTWLYHIVVRVCLDRRRLARWEAEVQIDELSLNVQRDETPGADIIHHRLLVERLLDQLSPPMRAAMVLREIEGLEYTEIAEILGIPVGTVRSRLNAARAKFRSIYEAALQEARNV